MEEEIDATSNRKRFDTSAASGGGGGEGDGSSSQEEQLSTTSAFFQGAVSWFKSLKNFIVPPSEPETEEVVVVTQTELKIVGEDKWVVLESDSSSSISSSEGGAMSASASAEGRSKNQLQPESIQVNGGTPVSHRKRVSSGASGIKSNSSSRSNSVSSKAHKLARPASPHTSGPTHSPVQRKASSGGKNTRPVNLEVHNGAGTSGNGASSSITNSPGRVRSSSPTPGIPKGVSPSSSARNSSPTGTSSPTPSRGDSKGSASQRSSSPPRGVGGTRNGKSTSSLQTSVSSSALRSKEAEVTKADSKSTTGSGKADGKVDSGGKPPSGKTAADIRKSSQRTSSPSLNQQGSSSNGVSGGGSFRMKKKGILVNSSTQDAASASGASPQPSHASGGLTNGISHGNQANASSSHPIPTIALPKDGGDSASSASGGNGSSEGASSAFEKVRDTLRISRPKKKKGKKLAYSIVVEPVPSTPEIHLHDPGKYVDPFETSYTENVEPGKKLDHDFKPASIPHNKPEYCDHCGAMAWGLYRQVLKCSRCNFIAHRKCETKVMMACSSRLENAILQHDKQVEDVERIATVEQVDAHSGKEPDAVQEPVASSTATPPSQVAPSSSSSSTSSSTSSSASSTPSSVTTTTTTTSSTSSTPTPASSQLYAEKTKLSRKIREYNRKTTPVHHIHIKSTHQVVDPSSIEYHGFVRVHMSVQRPIHVSTAITRTSWYRLMRPVKERTLNGNDVDGYDIQTAFYLPLDTNRLVHIQNTTTTKELIQILLKKFCVTDNPKKFSLYEEYGSDCRRLFEEDRPLEISLDASVSHRNSKLVLRDNTYSTIQWDAFSAPELGNFIQILQREEELYIAKMEERFSLWRKVIQQSLKDKCMEEQAKKTKKSVASRLTKHKLSPKPGRKLPASMATKASPKTAGRKAGK